ncbi:MAG: hypothetical protein JSW17_04200 [Candidatus Omnitrophota bacterium]|nr:MAG: hypothetical protein JSW17_04200 [Candidatus Omnitrophota bacterium]
MKMRWFFIFVVVISAGALMPASDVYADFAFSTKAGTLGAGVEGIKRINSMFNFRIGANAFQFEYDGTESEIEYDIDIDLLSFSALVDFFPFGRGFRITAGVMRGENELEFNAKPSATYQIGDTTYTLSEVGSLTGKLDFDGFGPYAGIGWGNPFGEGKRWTLTMDIGVMVQGSPNVDLSADGTLSGAAAFLADLANEENNLQNALEDYEFYPVVMVGLSYRF